MSHVVRRSGRKRPTAVDPQVDAHVSPEAAPPLQPKKTARRTTADTPGASVQKKASARGRKKAAVYDAGADPSPLPIARLLSTVTLQSAVDFLSKADERLAALAAEHGLPNKLLAKEGNCFQSLASSIVYQQLAGKAADAIYSRVLACCKCEDPLQLQPSMILSASEEDLRKAGLSQRKLSYLMDLASHFHNGHLDDDIIAGMEHSELRAKLITIKGIGPWTIDMFAIFHLGHPDILPVGDLGVRKGMQLMFKLNALPSPEEMVKLTESWRPYRSVGSYYMWRMLTTKTADSTADI